MKSQCLVQSQQIPPGHCCAASAAGVPGPAPRLRLGGSKEGSQLWNMAIVKNTWWVTSQTCLTCRNATCPCLEQCNPLRLMRRQIFYRSPINAKKNTEFYSNPQQSKPKYWAIKIPPIPCHSSWLIDFSTMGLDLFITPNDPGGTCNSL